MAWDGDVSGDIFEAVTTKHQAMKDNVEGNNATQKKEDAPLVEFYGAHGVVCSRGCLQVSPRHVGCLF